METIKVICGIIWKNKKVFIARRKPEKYLGGYWEFPGGKLESKETYEETLIRELNEELGMNVIVKKQFMTVLHKYENFKVELISFFCQFQDANFIMTDHDKFEWVNVSELTNWNLAPADIPIAEQLRIMNPD